MFFYEREEKAAYFFVNIAVFSLYNEFFCRKWKKYLMFFKIT